MYDVCLTGHQQAVLVSIEFEWNHVWARTTSPYPVCERFFLTGVLEMSSLKCKPDCVTFLAENTVGAPHCSGQHGVQNPKRDSSVPPGMIPAHSSCCVPAHPPHPAPGFRGRPWPWRALCLAFAPSGLLSSRQNGVPLFAASVASRALCWAHLPTSLLPWDPSEDGEPSFWCPSTGPKPGTRTYFRSHWHWYVNGICLSDMRARCFWEMNTASQAASTLPSFWWGS